MNPIGQKLHAVIELAHRLEKEPKAYGTDLLVTGTEIHLIEIVGDNEGFSVSDIARAFGVTRGAVSQKLKVLEKKGLVEKEVDPADRKRVIVVLTPTGMDAYLAHRRWHELKDGGFEKYYKELPLEKRETIIEYLGRVEEFYTRLLSVKI